MDALVIILMGPPGAGKGTHAGPLSRHLGFPHISTGDLFRENIRNHTPLGIQAKTFIDQGNLVPDDLVLNMLMERVARPDCTSGYILDGFPRTLAQAQTLDRTLAGEKVVVLNFNLADEIIIDRIVGRIACKQCSRPYHIKYDPPKVESICDSCQGPLYQRNDDNEEIVRNRLKVYHLQTKPLIQYYAVQKDVLHNLDAAQAKDEVFAGVLDSLSHFASPLNR